MRRKLWEIDPNYHCSILGTCLSMEDLGKIIRKLKLPFPSNTPPYAIHGFFVGKSGESGPEARLLHKRIDGKYRLTVERYAGFKSSKTIREAWELDLEKGELPGAYWALMSHPLTTADLEYAAFSAVHMLSHLQGAANRADIKLLKNLEKKNSGLEASLVRLSAEFSRRTSLKNREIQELQAEVKRIPELENKLVRLRREAKESQCREQDEIIKAQLDDLREKLAEATERSDSLADRLQSQKQLNAELRKTCLHLVKEREESRKEKEALERFLDEVLPVGGSDSGNGTGNCRKACLKGQTLLYVGGKSNLIQHYRAIVNHHGGEFLYHDGGLEQNRSRLLGLLSRATMVYCPVDCVSHNACLRLKKECKRRNLLCRMMHSSGISSLAREVLHFSDSTPIPASPESRSTG